MRHSSLKNLGLLSLVILMSGCAHYHLGTGNQPLPYHSISFAPVVNNSYAPQIHTLVSDALFRAFATGGGMVVEGQNDGADVTLRVTVDDFQKGIGATSSSDTGRARSLYMSLKATATLTDASGKVLNSQQFEVSQEIYADSGLARAEQAGLPEIAEKLASQIYSAVVSKW